MRRSNDNSTGNRLLDRLRAVARALEPLVEPVVLEAKKTVHEPGRRFDHVYFPTSAVISTSLTDDEGREVETSTVGNEGMSSVYAAMGVDHCPRLSVCQVEGESLRAPYGAFTAELLRQPAADLLMKRYAASALRSAEQSILCNALHPVEERLARWLLLLHDRVGKDQLPVTHEFLAEMLGVRRPTISLVAGTLQHAGLISCQRGVVHIRNRAGLEAAACECYAAICSLNGRFLDGERA
jgi:CRP-like cAMP-binding protein